MDTGCNFIEYDKGDSKSARRWSAFLSMINNRVKESAF